MKPKYDIPFTPDEEKIQRTISASLAAFRAGQEQQRAGYLAFLLQQSRYIRKRWWALQGLLLALMGWLLRQMQTDLAVRRCLGTIAPLFALLILPELWKNRASGATEIEGTTFYSLRQVYAARLTLFAGADLLLMSVFLPGMATAARIDLLELGIHFLLPFCVTCCICLRCLYCRRVRSELVPMLLSMVWTGLWLLVVLNETVYHTISAPVWMLLLAASVCCLIFCVLRGQYNLKNWEIQPIWN